MVAVTKPDQASRWTFLGLHAVRKLHSDRSLTGGTLRYPDTLHVRADTNTQHAYRHREARKIRSARHEPTVPPNGPTRLLQTKLHRVSSERRRRQDNASSFSTGPSILLILDHKPYSALNLQVGRLGYMNGQGLMATTSINPNCRGRRVLLTYGMRRLIPTFRCARSLPA
jgi:hypothetical protein